MKKNTVRAIAVLLILLAAYHIVVFAVPFAHTGTFWVSYGFGLAAFGILGIGAYLGLVKGTDIRSKFYGFPILKISATHFVFQLLVSMIVMAIPVIPIAFAWVVYAVSLGAAAVGMLSADAVRDEVERQEGKQRKTTAAMLNLRMKAAALPELTNDADTKRALERLAENFRFSDPVSSSAVHDMDQELDILLDSLKTALLKDASDITDLCAQTGRTLTERNRLCKQTK